MMQEKSIEPIVAVKDHGEVYEVAMGSTSFAFAPVMADIKRTMQDKRIELIVAVKDQGGVFDVTMGSTPL